METKVGSSASEFNTAQSGVTHDARSQINRHSQHGVATYSMGMSNRYSAPRKKRKRYTMQAILEARESPHDMKLMADSRVCNSEFHDYERPSVGS